MAEPERARRIGVATTSRAGHGTYQGLALFDGRCQKRIPRANLPPAARLLRATTLTGALREGTIPSSWAMVFSSYFHG